MHLTVAEAAKAKNTTRFSIHRWIESGLKFEWVKGKRVIDRKDLHQFHPRAVGNPNFGKKRGRPRKIPAA